MEEEGEKNPILVFFTNVLAAIKLPFPFPPKKVTDSSSAEPAVASSQAEESTKINPAVVEEENDNLSIVTFPRQSFVPLKQEPGVAEKERSTNPVLIWQVYAIGGFLVLRWAWKRWNEHKGRKKSDDEPPPACD